MIFDGRLLILGTADHVVSRQIGGEDLDLADCGPLRADVSTDEITPLPRLLDFDDRLGAWAHTGTVINGERPITECALLTGGFGVIVAGPRYGKGSSREHSPLAERAAGIRLIIAESFERIYRQNCDNLGLWTSTDLGLAERLRRGEDIPVEDLLVGRDPLAAAILQAGGLLAFGKTRLAECRDFDTPVQGPQSLAEKIVRRHALQIGGLALSPTPGGGCFVRAQKRFIHEYYTGMAAHLLEKTHADPIRIHDPDSILLFEDHNSYAHRSPTHVTQGLLPKVQALSQAHREFAQKHALKNHGYLVGEEGSEGISHAMMTELYALPGEIIVGTDSHTPHSGAIGCFAYGVGTTDMANAFLTGVSRLSMSEGVLVRLEGRLPQGVTAKDVMLELLATEEIRSGRGIGKIFEFVGPIVDAMSIDERATLTNMVAELGGLTGLCAPDETTRRFLRERRGIDFDIACWMHSDPDASYAFTINLDCNELEPMLASPGDPGNGLRMSELREDVTVTIAYGGSCTAGKREDFDRYFEVAEWAVKRGLRVAPGVRLYLQCGTVQVRDYCEERGYLPVFKALGAELLGPACGACGQCGPGVSTRSDEVTISAINRNFPGRGGPGSTWLASPPTVVASAISGKISSFAELRGRYPGSS